MHFYCSNHRTIFCRECIQVDHTNEKCFVVDLYEIEKLRKLQSQNISLNKSQLAKRKDGATVSCVVAETFKPMIPKKIASKNIENEYAWASATQPMQHNVQPIYDYGNEGDLTNEGDNTAEIYMAPPPKKLQTDNWTPQQYLLEQQQDDYDEEDEEEGEFMPHYQGKGGMEDIANYQEMLRVHQMMKMAEGQEEEEEEY